MTRVAGAPGDGTRLVAGIGAGSVARRPRVRPERLHALAIGRGAVAIGGRLAPHAGFLGTTLSSGT